MGIAPIASRASTVDAHAIIESLLVIGNKSIVVNWTVHLMEFYHCTFIKHSDNHFLVSTLDVILDSKFMPTKSSVPISPPSNRKSVIQPLD